MFRRVGAQLSWRSLRISMPCVQAAACASLITLRNTSSCSNGGLKDTSLSACCCFSSFCTLCTSRRTYATSGDNYEFDPMASIRHDAAVEVAKKSIDSVILDLVPPNAPVTAIEKVRQYLEQHPIDALIVEDTAQITHVQNVETGKEDRVSLSPCSTSEALEQAKERGMNLVQMASREGTAFCRIRDEKPWILKRIEEDMKNVEVAEESLTHAAAAVPTKLRPLANHQFRDVVDAHFIGWKSKKICEDLRKGHPVKLTIKDFQSPEAAILKLREMANAMEKYSNEKNIFHHFTSIVANDKEASITFSPPEANKSGTVSRTVKHPSASDWAGSQKRMQAACAKAGRTGTYMKVGGLKPRNVGTTTYRVDKYGRRID